MWGCGGWGVASQLTHPNVYIPTNHSVAEVILTGRQRDRAELEFINVRDVSYMAREERDDSTRLFLPCMYVCENLGTTLETSLMVKSKKSQVSGRLEEKKTLEMS